MKGVISGLLLLFLFVSCKKDNPEQKNSEDIRYKYFGMESRGWKSLKENQHIDDINFTATEVPIEYYLLQSEGKDDLSRIDSIYQQNKNERIIEFEFTQEDEQDLLSPKFTGIDYGKGVEYLSFAIQNDFYVVTSKQDTLQCVGAHFERNYKVAPFHRVILYFSGVPYNDNVQLIYNDKLFGKGTVKFRFKDNISKVLL